MAAVLTVGIWTSFILIARASAAHTLLPLDIGLLRVLGASLVLLPWGWWLGRHTDAPSSFWGLSPLALKPTLWTGLVGGTVYAGLCYTGFFFAPALHASVLMPGTLPLWTALLAVLLLGERLSRARLLALGCILLGGAVVGGSALWSAFDGGRVWVGDLLFMATALCWAGYGVLARRFALDPVRATIAIMVFACLSYIPLFALLTASGWLPTRLGQAGWGEIAFQMLFQGLGSVVISGITFVHMVRVFGPVRSTMVTSLVPGLSALGAVLLLGEPLGANLLAGLALVTAGILLGVRATAQAPRAPALSPDPTP